MATEIRLTQTSLSCIYICNSYTYLFYLYLGSMYGFKDLYEKYSVNTFFFFWRVRREQKSEVKGRSDEVAFTQYDKSKYCGVQLQPYDMWCCC